MIEYKFSNSTTKNGSTYNVVAVAPPHDYLSLIFEGNELPERIQEIIDGITRVKNKEVEDFYFGNDTGFSAVATQANPDNKSEPDEGVYIYDGYGEEPEKALFIVPLEEILQLLEDFLKFLEENKK